MHAFHRYSYPAVRMYLQVMRPRRVRGLPRIIEIIFGGAPPRQKYLSRRERAPISAHTGGSALNAAPVTIGFSRGTVGTKTAQPFSARENKKSPKDLLGLWDRNKLYPAVPPKLACSPLVPCHHTAGAVTGAIPGVSFAPLLSPFPEPSAAALSAYAPLSEDFVSRVLLSVIGFTHLA